MNEKRDLHSYKGLKIITISLIVFLVSAGVSFVYESVIVYICMGLGFLGGIAGFSIHAEEYFNRRKN